MDMNPPGPMEMEISLLGPGYGECVLVHVGAGDWIVVDSCVEVDDEPAALAYLEALGVDPATAVRVIVASHWDDDHIRGLSKVVSICAQATFILSEALTTNEFFTLAHLSSRPSVPSMSRSGMREMFAIKDTLSARVDIAGGVPARASASKRLWHREEDANVLGAELWCVAPSDAQVTHGMESIQQQVARLLGERRRGVRESVPNSTSVVLEVFFGDTSVLLGGDLEETPHTGTGWTAVLDSRKGTSCVFKVPHHGSQDAHSDEIWEEALCSHVAALVAPWRRGGGSLPQATDLTRLCQRSSTVYLTSDPTARRQVKRRGPVQRTINEATRRIEVAEPPFGHVRVRLPILPDTNTCPAQYVSLRGAAHRVC